jgi:hypothetical protein
MLKRPAGVLFNIPDQSGSGSNCVRIRMRLSGPQLRYKICTCFYGDPVRVRFMKYIYNILQG